ncbi:MAG: urease [Pseudohongiella sp.]|nr:MAG: urease [Pseudohongiella sp.]
MLELRPNCENCDKDLPPDSPQACICTYECTFCSHCVKHVLFNVCPNCGGGFTKRPIRPQTERRPGVSLQHQPASNTRVHTKYTDEEIAQFAGATKSTRPEDR